MSNAREQLALRNLLTTHLQAHELRAITWPTVMREATPALDRGWTGDELARWCLGDLGNDVDNVGALIVSVLRDLGTQDPPRDITPTPPHINQLRAEQARARAAANNVNHHEWANHLRTAIHETQTRICG